MASIPPRSKRRRARPGSLERPVNGRLYRGTWLLVGLPLLVAAFSVARPAALPRSSFIPAFNGGAAKALASDLVNEIPDRSPGSARAPAAVDWFRGQLEPYGLPVRSESFSAEIPGRGRVRLENLVAEAVGRSPGTIVVMAHRDNDGRGPGANDNASGTAVLVQLARAYAAPPGVAVSSAPPEPHDSLPLDRRRFGRRAGRGLVRGPLALRHDVEAVVNLDAVGGGGPLRVEFNGDVPRTPSATLIETVAARAAAQTGVRPARSGLIRQLVDLGFPYSFYEHAPFLTHGIGAVTLTTAGDHLPNPLFDTPGRLRTDRLAEAGRTAQDIVGSLDDGLEFARGTSSYLYLGSRLIRGWAVELVLIACLLPFLATAIDLFARCRRRRIPLGPALRSYRSRLAFWAWVIALFELFGLLRPGARASLARSRPEALSPTMFPRRRSSR